MARRSATALTAEFERRLAALDWNAIARSLDERGYATIPALITAARCAELAAMYDERERFRSRVVMERVRFGVGEYKYFAPPLPPLVGALRAAIYPHLAPIANRWCARWAGMRHIRPISSASWRFAGAPARPSRRRCCSVTRRAATTACTRTSTAKSPFHPAHLPAEPGRERFQRRRIPAGREPAARAEPRRSGRAGAGRGDHIRDQRAAGRRQPRALSGDDASRGEPGASRPPPDPRDHFSRREVTRASAGGRWRTG